MSGEVGKAAQVGSVLRASSRGGSSSRALLRFSEPEGRGSESEPTPRSSAADKAKSVKLIQQVVLQQRGSGGVQEEEGAQGDHMFRHQAAAASAFSRQQDPEPKSRDSQGSSKPRYSGQPQLDNVDSPGSHLGHSAFSSEAGRKSASTARCRPRPLIPLFPTSPSCRLPGVGAAPEARQFR